MRQLVNVMRQHGGKVVKMGRPTCEAECRAQMARLLAWAHSARRSAMGCPGLLAADYKGTARRMLQEAGTLRRGLADHLAMTRATPTLP